MHSSPIWPSQSSQAAPRPPSRSCRNVVPRALGAPGAPCAPSAPYACPCRASRPGPLRRASAAPRAQRLVPQCPAPSALVPSARALQCLACCVVALHGCVVTLCRYTVQQPQSQYTSVYCDTVPQPPSLQYKTCNTISVSLLPQCIAIHSTQLPAPFISQYTSNLAIQFGQ